MGFWERREHARAAREYESAAEQWLKDSQRNLDYCRSFMDAEAGAYRAQTVALRDGERFIGTRFGASLVKGKTSYQTVGVSRRLGDSSTRISFSNTSSLNYLAEVDSGDLYLTDRRAIFTGSMRTIEWWWSRVLSIVSDGTTAMIHVSDRQATQGVRVGWRAADRLGLELDIAVALHDGTGSALFERLLDRQRPLMKQIPTPPPGHPGDPRVEQMRRKWTPAEAAPKLAPTDIEEGTALNRADRIMNRVPTGPLPSEPTPVEVSTPSEQKHGGPPARGDDSTTPDIVIAGVPVAEPAAILLDYLHIHSHTIDRYDMRAGSFSQVDADLIAATRVIASRISNAEGEWLIEQARTAPWPHVPADADLAEADPVIENGLYDQAMKLWSHFYDHAPPRLAGAKIHKVLHLMRPALVPILDSRLRKKYDTTARQAGADLARTRPAVSAPRNYWAAIRLDLIRNQDQLNAIRAVAAAHDPRAASLTGLRIMDILTWSEEQA